MRTACRRASEADGSDGAGCDLVALSFYYAVEEKGQDAYDSAVSKQVAWEETCQDTKCEDDSTPEAGGCCEEEVSGVTGCCPDEVPCLNAKCYNPEEERCCDDGSVSGVSGCCPDERGCLDGSCILQDECCPDEELCLNEKCYNPGEERCCDDGSLSGVTGCCPDERGCPDGTCILQDECCPDEELCLKEKCYNPEEERCCDDGSVSDVTGCCPDERGCLDGSCVLQDECCPDEQKCGQECVDPEDFTCCDDGSIVTIGTSCPVPCEDGNGAVDGECCPNEELCLNEKCYNPEEERCCNDGSLSGVTGCCPDERGCLNGSCILQDECCPDEEKCGEVCLDPVHFWCCEDSSFVDLGDACPFDCDDGSVPPNGECCPNEGQCSDGSCVVSGQCCPNEPPGPKCEFSGLNVPDNIAVAIIADATGGFAGPGSLVRAPAGTIEIAQGNDAEASVSGTFLRDDGAALPSSTSVFVYVENLSEPDDFIRGKRTLSPLTGEFSAVVADIPAGNSRIFLSFVVTDPDEALNVSEVGADTIFALPVFNSACTPSLTITLEWRGEKHERPSFEVWEPWKDESDTRPNLRKKVNLAARFGDLGLMKSSYSSGFGSEHYVVYSGLDPTTSHDLNMYAVKIFAYFEVIGQTWRLTARRSGKVVVDLEEAGTPWGYRTTYYFQEDFVSLIDYNPSCGAYNPSTRSR